MKWSRWMLFVAAALPVLLLAALFPDKIVRTPERIEKLYSVPGAPIVAFTQRDCPHCRSFRKFALAKGWPVEYYELGEREGREQFEKLKAILPQLTWSTPTIIVDTTVIQGFSESRTGPQLEAVYEGCSASAGGCLPFAAMLSGKGRPAQTLYEEVSECTPDAEAAVCLPDDSFVMHLWFIGDIDLRTLSLPVVSALIGFLDGFNPCAMWVLVTLLTMLVVLNDLRKMLIIGCTFLFVSGAMYYLFIAAWLNVFLMIGYNFWVQKAIGVLAVAGGILYLDKGIGENPDVCTVTDYQQRQAVRTRIQKILAYTGWPMVLAGVTLLAISVNMIELVCTAGLPAIYTQLLAFSGASTLEKYLYMLIYIILYMIDDIAIFLITIFTMQATGLTTRYRRLTLLLGGGLMYALGILMIYFPEALVVG